ncbi:protein eva-1 homolog C isoform X1 [Esox lucius]|uniref:SUEL-type lectin domain-containing protein n=1 Tax=Esox lucius TaxID=8010 RepID=A0A3P8XXR3_ESOLU|nr:protein eva-1 homolog C isoform X1 [Esox lucius]
MLGEMRWSGSRDRRSLSGSSVHLLYISLLLWCSGSGMDGLADFSSYLSRIITSQSAHACDGQHLLLHCPRHSSISIQSAFYGRADTRLCTNTTAVDVKAAKNNCSAFAALQKLLSECQSLRDCGLLVNHLVFGLDPCPGTTKYLHVNYRCTPAEHKTRVVCEGEKLTLHCKAPRVLLIYTGVYGRGLGQDHTCPTPPRGSTLYDCWNHDAVHTLSQSCYSKQRCVIAVNNQTFRDPCYPGTRKYLTVLYSCVPQTLLKEADPSFRLEEADQAHPGLTPAHPGPPTVHPGLQDLAIYPKDSRRPVNTGDMMSNSLMTFAFIKDHPEKAALLFTSSVCVGLLLTLVAVSARMTCRGRCHTDKTHTCRSQVQEGQDEDDDDDDDDDDEDEEEMEDCSLLSDADRKLAYRWEEVGYTTEAAEMVERLERREMVIQEIWMNSYYNVLLSRQDPLLTT